jgi:argininosuccinate lyase
MTTSSFPSAVTGDPPRALDINEVFRGGGRSVEFLDQINKASIVMLCESRILPRELGSRIARGIAHVMDDVPHAQRSADYLDYEPRLVAIAGPEASRLHTGRSRQDIASTIARMNLRDGLLQEHAALLSIRRKLLALAEQHKETIIPAYTHGVQAQPTTFAHYLLAFVAAFGRQSLRMQQAYERINRNPLGAAALATSSFPLDRERLAELLGFGGLVENAYDANHLAPIDAFLDAAAALAIAAVQIGQLAQDLHAQYAEPRPWFLLQTGKLTGTSSIMPQKRNPAALEQLRAQASLMLGDMQTVFLMGHNVRTGMFDYRSYDPVPCARPLQVLKLLGDVIDGIIVDRERALEEVNADYSTTTEIADALLQRAEVPFRVGHHFASMLTDYGRSRRLRLSDIPFAEAQRIYQDQTQQKLPLSEPDFRQVISAEYMVFGRRGLGGPQIAEVERMLARELERADDDDAWVIQQTQRLAGSSRTLDDAFEALAAE